MKIIALVGLALIASGCSMRVSGSVTDRDTGHPIGACSVVVGGGPSGEEVSTHTDPNGNYTLKTGHRHQETVKFIAQGYAVKTATVNAETTRYPIVDVQLIRLRATAAPPGARFDPYTGEPLRNEVPRYDPYTGKPIDPAHPAAGSAPR